MITELRPGVFLLGIQDWHRRLFDELIPLPDGTSYNAYLIDGGEKTALVDTADPSRREEFLAVLAATGKKRLDYLVSHHAEQDHAGLIPDVLRRYPEIRVLTSDRGKTFLMDLLHLPAEKIQVVADGEKIPLGRFTLEFILAPWVHWPETMLTYLTEEKILFSCDLFGSHLATSGVAAEGWPEVYQAAKRYYAEIMMPFRPVIAGHLAKLATKQISLIAPSHGPVHYRPELILKAYHDWISPETKNEVLVIFVSMHGSVALMVQRLVDRLISSGITVRPFNLTATDPGQLAIALVDASTVVLATPTVLGGPHPVMMSAATLIRALRPKIKFLAVLSSFLWGGQAQESLENLLAPLKVKILPAVKVRGCPTAADLERVDQLAQLIAAEHAQAGLTQKT
ncbi:MAG TPA: FprA family A-type flavoprotein [bacterium]|nr:FprA family A-type flavoprotein [bacterium]